MFDPALRNVWLHRRHHNVKERNIPSAILSLVFIIIVASALAQPRWFYLKGGGCTRKFLGVQEFFFQGHITSLSSSFKEKGMSDCVTLEIINVDRSIIILCCISLLVTMVQFFLDVIGVRHKFLWTIKRNAVFSITSSILMVIIIGLCFYASELMKTQQEKTKLIATTSVQIDFGVSYYLIIGAGVVGIITAGTNLLRRYRSHLVDDAENLLDDCQAETFSVALPHSHTWSNYRHPGLPELPPPPPYTP